jgi:transposase
MKKKRRQFSAAFKAEVVLSVLSGAKTAASICREHQISAQQLSNWKRQFLENASRVFEKDEARDQDQTHIAELERKVGQLTMQLEVAKKVSTRLNSTASRNGRW